MSKTIYVVNKVIIMKEKLTKYYPTTILNSIKKIVVYKIAVPQFFFTYYIYNITKLGNVKKNLGKG